MLVPLGCDAEVEHLEVRSAPEGAGPPAPSGPPNVDQSSLEELGEFLFFDERLSVNFNQACAACHGPDVGWTGPDLLSNASGGIYEGSVEHRFGNRRAPSAAYNVFAPVFEYSDGEFVGGTFWDARATGWVLGDPAADQAQGPFLNPVEQALPDPAIVVERVCKSDYKQLFRWIWGPSACSDVEYGYDSVAYSIAAYERSTHVSPFQSKYDAYLAGEASLTPAEQHGLELFSGAALCSRCHTLDVTAGAPGPLLTDFGYNNLGVPRNIDNLFYRMDDVFIDGEPINPLGFDWIDPGLGGFIERLAADAGWRSLPYVPDSMLQLSQDELADLAESSLGKHKVPTLRNIEQRPFPSFIKNYMHNGYFETLAGVVHFYNTRDVLPTCAGDFREAEALALGCWPAPEVPQNVTQFGIGDLGLSPSDEADLVAFLETLTDE